MSAPIIPGKPCDTKIGFGPWGQRDWAEMVVNQWNDDGISPHPLDRDHGDFRREIMRGWVHRTLSQDRINEGIRSIHQAAWLQIRTWAELSLLSLARPPVGGRQMVFPLPEPSHEP